VIHKGLEIRGPKSISIGVGTVVGFDCILDGRGPGAISISKNVTLSSETTVWTGKRDYRSPVLRDVGAPVKVGDRGWLSFRCIVLPGVTVGERAVTTAGAVVMKDVPQYAVMAGFRPCGLPSGPGTLTLITSREKAIRGAFDARAYLVDEL
jgi:acetyltransferase-like isoleucine patch superfamily enzyme